MRVPGDLPQLQRSVLLALLGLAAPRGPAQTARPGPTSATDLRRDRRRAVTFQSAPKLCERTIVNPKTLCRFHV